MISRIIIISALIVSIIAIKVPINTTEESDENKPITTDTTQTDNIPIYYKGDTAIVDSYLIPPNPHTVEEVLPDSIVTPASYLLPPAVEKQNTYYYAPTESSEQTDWYPIQVPPKEQSVKFLPPRSQVPVISILANVNQSKPSNILSAFRAGKSLRIPVPSIKLEPPSENASDEYIITVPSQELELPAEEIDHSFLKPNVGHSIEPHAISHRPFTLNKYKNPTKLYPKKFAGSFKPVPIPLSHFADSLEVPKAKPVKYFKPLTGFETPILTPIDEKKIYQYETAEQKRKLKTEESEAAQDSPTSLEDSFNATPQTEQDVSETNLRYPGHNVYHERPVLAPIRQAPIPVPVQHTPHSTPLKQAPTSAQNNHPAPDDRTEFRMHGMKGPHSYQFGYDTGKGKNRQFRYEERDNDGLVRGHYGYVDKHGKLRVVNYRAHPEHGFQAEPQEENKEE